MDQSKVGRFIKELRKEKNLTQEQLAEQFNVSRRTVSRWETGNNLPDLDVFYFVVGIVGMFAHITLDFVELPETFLVGLLEGFTFGLGLAAMVLGILYVTGAMTKIRAFQLRLIGREQ